LRPRQQSLRRSRSECIAVFDVGTTNVKSVIIDVEGNVLSKSIKEIPLITPRPEFIELDPEVLWKTATETMKEAVRTAGVSPDNVLAIGVCTQRATVIPLDKDIKPLYNAITWMDGRRSKSAESIWKQIIQRVLAIKFLWFKDEKPEILERMWKFVTVDTYMYLKLAESCVCDFSNAAYGPFDVKSLKWSDQLSEIFKVPIDKLPDIAEPGTVVGELTSSAAEEIGLKKGTPVICGSGDQQCSSIALGVVERGRAKATTGTGTFLDVCVDAPPFDFYQSALRIFCLPHAIKNLWLLEGVLPTTGAIYRWLRDKLSENVVEMARSRNVDPYVILDEEAEKVGPGADGLIVVPLFSFSKGVIHGLSLEHGRAHIARAILESVGFGLRLFLRFMEAFGIKVEELYVDGGGMRSRLWRRILADITGKKIVLPENIEDCSSIGAAILAAWGVKFYPSIEKAVKGMTRIVEALDPNPDNKKVYDQIYPRFEKLIMSVAAELPV